MNKDQSENVLFMRNAMHREEAARIKQFLMYKDLIYKNSKIESSLFEKQIKKINSEKDETNKKISEITNVINKDSLETINKYKRLKNVDELIIKASQECPDLADTRCFFCPMREVDSKHLELLYNDTDKLGTKKYLNARYELPPEKKFCFPEVTSWDYGWKVRDKNVRDKFCGRANAINNYIWRGTGLAMFQTDKQVPLTCGCPLICSFSN